MARHHDAVQITDRALVHSLKKGQPVEFSFDKQGDDYRLTKITR